MNIGKSIETESILVDDKRREVTPNQRINYRLYSGIGIKWCLHNLVNILYKPFEFYTLKEEFHGTCLYLINFPMLSQITLGN